jgi:hypothetical protein
MNILNIKVEDYPPKLHPILRRLQKAVQEKGIRHGMDVEDEFLQDLKEYEDRIERAEHQIKEERRQKEEAQRREEEAQRREEEAQRQNEEAILLMLRIGVDRKTIAENLGRSLDEIEKIETRNRKE